MGEERLIQGFGGKPEIKRILGRPGCSGKNNIKIDFQELVFECMYWVELAQNRYRWQAIVNAVMNLRAS